MENLEINKKNRVQLQFGHLLGKVELREIIKLATSAEEIIANRTAVKAASIVAMVQECSLSCTGFGCGSDVGMSASSGGELGLQIKQANRIGPSAIAGPQTRGLLQEAEEVLQVPTVGTFCCKFVHKKRESWGFETKGTRE